MSKETAKESLEKFMSGRVTKMRGIMEQRGLNASGNTSRNIEYKISGLTGTLLAPDHIQYLEKGRGPTQAGSSSGPTLRERIRQWIDDKGITPQDITKDSLAFLIARKIHEEGTLLHRRGQQTGILSQTIGESEIDKFFKDFASVEIDAAKSLITVAFKQISK